MKYIMDWDEWIKLTPEEQEAIRLKYDWSNEPIDGALMVEQQIELLRELTK